MQGRGDFLTRPVPLAKEDDLALETRCAVRPNVEQSLGRRMAHARIGDAHHILSARLSGRDRPVERDHAVLRPGPALGHGVAFGALDLDSAMDLTLVRQRRAIVRMQNDASNVQRLTRPVDRLIGADVGQIPLRPAQITGRRAFGQQRAAEQTYGHYGHCEHPEPMCLSLVHDPRLR